MEAILHEKSLGVDFYINKIETAFSFKGTRPTRLLYHRMLILEEAASIVKIDSERIAIKANEVLLAAKGQVILFANNCQIKGYEIMFTDGFWEKAPQSASNCKSVLFDQKSNNQTLPIGPCELPDLKNLLKMLYEDFHKPPFTNKADVLAAYLKILMITIANINYSAQQRYSGYDKDIFLEFQNLISLNYKESREVSFYAESLHVSAKQLYEICQRQAGLSPKKLISSKIIEEAKRLLQFSSISIKEIALTMNFMSNEQFSHFFKKISGMSPQKYRLSVQ